MQEVYGRLEEHGLKIKLTSAAKEWLAGQGYDESFGARPLKRAVQRYVESPLSVRLLEGKFSKGDHVLIDAPDGELTFTRQDDANGLSASDDMDEGTREEDKDPEEVDEVAVS
jgi:ATP-dependent Clp protease ATP-binding subunit ClpC